MALTARQVWEGMLTELSKANAPSLLLHEFNYYFNKAINQYINKRYNIYDVSQQTTDDLRVLKATAILTPKQANAYDDYSAYGAGASKLFGATYEVTLPDDYLHMLNCICIYKMAKNHRCYNQGDYVDFAAKRLTADSWPTIINDYYNRPLPERPYYYIHNVNQNETVPTNPVRNILNDENEVIEIDGTDMIASKYDVITNGKDNVNPLRHPNELVTDKSGKKPGESGYEETWKNDTPAVSNFPRTITLNNTSKTKISVIERETAQRYGNASRVRCEIRYGRDNTVYQLDKVFIDYIKAPQTIRLTKEQVDLTEDTSQVMEFPDYVCQEIINELVLLVMSRDADPRLQVQSQVTQSIANPAQQQAPQPQPQQRGS